MGLLGDSIDDPKSMATYNLVAGLLSPGSFGQGLGRGLQGYQGSLAANQEMQLKQQEIATAKQNMAMQQIQMQMALRKQNYMFGDDATPANPAATPQAPINSVPPVASFMPGSGSQSPDQNSMNMALANTPRPAPTPEVQPPQDPSIDPRFGLRRDMVRADMIMNDGKQIATFMHDQNKPVSLRPGGYAAYADGRVEQMPTVPEGFQAIRGANGQWQMVPVSGGTEAIGASSAAKASGAAGFKQTEIINPDGSKSTVFNKDLPGFAGSPPATALPTASTPRFVFNDQAKAREQIAAAKDPALLAAFDKQHAPPSAAAPIGVKTGFAPGVIKNAEVGATNAQDTMTESYKSVRAGNQSAQTTQARLDNISALATKAITGGNTEWRDFANNLAQMAGISDRAMDRKTAGDLIDKNAAQIALAAGAGAQGTDALRALAGKANPGREMTPDAIKEAVGQLQASAQVQQAKAQLLTPHFNNQDPATYNKTEQVFDKNADYRVFQIVNDTKGMAPAQIQAYFQSKGYSPAQVQQFRQQRATLQGLGVQL